MSDTANTSQLQADRKSPGDAGDTGSSMGRKIVRLRSAEGDSCELPYEAAVLSILVKNTIDVEDSDDDGDNNDGEDAENDASEEMYEIDIPKVGTNCLANIVKFLRHHATEPMHELQTPLNGTDIDTILASQPWYRNYISDMDRPMVFRLVQAANYMEIQPLLDIACLRVSTELVGKSAEEIRIILNLPKMTPEEEEEARKKHPWIFE